MMWKLPSRVISNSIKPTFLSNGVWKSFHSYSFPLLNDTSIFGDLTKAPQNSTPQVQENSSVSQENETSPASTLPKDDEELKKYHLEAAERDQIAIEKFVTPLKRKLFDLNVATNGFYKNNQVVKDPETNKVYKLSLSNREIEILEPSIYLQSLRIKSSVKKATVVNRFVRGYNVKTAITQLHFNQKKMATELEKLLKEGLELARSKGYDDNKLYIQEVWSGSDGDTMRRPDVKGRGRVGVLHHRHIHVKAILKTEQTLNRLKWEKEQKELNSKPKMILNNEPLNFRVKSFYKW
ncbi:54S ribosomal protein L22, mitochondrial [[Candida] railenensis]|uniref:54S ribosomal protein L22, mitochondrial n=1 Tax=[Candida] railenensis TaxID=45579 RepID=A0A9P0VZP3_9ASCO|nr:54S ribosomal protein L22, mitochondrial [[Candida] railenensis]